MLNKKVLMAIKTRRLETDDRLRKECLSIRSLGCDVEVFAWVDENNERINSCYKGIKSIQKRLFTRFLNSRLFLAVHLFEFVCKLLTKRKKSTPDIVWVHDPIMFIAVFALKLSQLCGGRFKIVWDQHEVPPKLIRKNVILKKIFSLACNSVNTLIVANKERGEYLKSELKVTTNIEVLNNFSDSSFITAEVTKLPEDVLRWLGGRPFLLAQNGADYKRNFRPLVESVVMSNKYPVLLVGYVDKAIEDELKSEFGSDYDRLFYKVGVVPQMELVRYLSKCLASVILYKNTDENQWYCEPNRLYQALNFNKPVIVGNNPTMANIVKAENAGLVLNDDGSNPEGLKKSFEDLDAFVSKYKGVKNSENYTWEAQSNIISRVVLQAC